MTLLWRGAGKKSSTKRSRELYHSGFFQVRADPDGRCAAMLIYGRKVVILPFRREASSTAAAAPGAAAEAAQSSTTSSGKVMATYMLNLEAVIQTNKVDNIIDIQFLHGYRYIALRLFLSTNHI